jgi:hypothetical protein
VENEANKYHAKKLQKLASWTCICCWWIYELILILTFFLLTLYGNI